MNLLRDKRDDEQPVNAAPDGSLSEDQFQEAGPGGAEQSVVKQKKSKNTFSTLLIAAAIFIIAILITYFGFYKPKEGSRVADSKTSSAQVDSTTDSADAVAISNDSDVSGEQSNNSRAQATGEPSLITASDFMQNIQNALGSGRVTAFFLDEGTFTTEIDAGSVGGATSVYNSIKSALPMHAKLTSSAPTGAHALISGSFDARSVSDPTGLSKDEIDNELRQMAGDAATTVSSLNVDAPEGEQSFVVMRISGSFDACRVFVDKLSQKDWSVSVSKLILMPGSGDVYTFVLRFYM